MNLSPQIALVGPVWIGLGLFAGRLSDSKGYPFWVGFMLGPVGLVIFLIMPKDEDRARAIVPLLRGLTHVQSILILDGAHHVFKNIPLSQEIQRIVSPVLDALDGTAPKLQVPIAARHALGKLEQL